MTPDLLYSCLVTASQLVLIAWTGILITASILTFREAPAAIRSAPGKKR